MTRVMKTKQKTFRVNRRYAEREFAVQKVGELIETREFEINLHLYKIVHIDDQDVLFERVTKKGMTDYPQHWHQHILD